MTPATKSPQDDPRSQTKASKRSSQATKSEKAGRGKASEKTKTPEGAKQYTFTINVPSPDRLANGAANAVLLPVAVARQVLPAKHGLPLYAGLGVLAVADVIEWPVAVGIGIGYAVLRGSGVLPPAPVMPKAKGTA